MYLIEKGRKPRPICRECRAIHKAKDCPKAKLRRERYPFISLWTLRKQVG